ncbi:hypothetical protein GCM10009080_17170 [Cupriavidus pauculus]
MLADARRLIAVQPLAQKGERILWQSRCALRTRRRGQVVRDFDDEPIDAETRRFSGQRRVFDWPDLLRTQPRGLNRLLALAGFLLLTGALVLFDAGG